MTYHILSPLCILGADWLPRSLEYQPSMWHWVCPTKPCWIKAHWDQCFSLLMCRRCDEHCCFPIVASPPSPLVCVESFGRVFWIAVLAPCLVKLQPLFRTKKVESSKQAGKFKSSGAEVYCKFEGSSWKSSALFGLVAFLIYEKWPVDPENVRCVEDAIRPSYIGYLYIISQYKDPVMNQTVWWNVNWGFLVYLPILFAWFNLIFSSMNIDMFLLNVAKFMCISFRISTALYYI